MLVIVNPYATTVSDRLKNLVVYALQGRYEVDAIETSAVEMETLHREKMLQEVKSPLLADIVPGQCLVATGQKDSAGLLVAMTVRLSPKTASGCAAAPNRVGPSPAAGASPRPIPSGQPAQAFVTGEVTGAAGVSITVLTTGSGSQTITVPTTATVTRMLSASATDLQTGQCIRANGSRDSAGTVQATSIAITPAGPSGTCTTGFGGRGPGRAGASPGAPAPNN